MRKSKKQRKLWYVSKLSVRLVLGELSVIYEVL